MKRYDMETVSRGMECWQELRRDDEYGAYVTFDDAIAFARRVAEVAITSERQGIITATVDDIIQQAERDEP